MEELRSEGREGGRGRKMMVIFFMGLEHESMMRRESHVDAKIHSLTYNWILGKGLYGVSLV